MLRLDRTKKYLSVEARWPISAICTHPRVDVGRLPVVEHLARAAAGGSSDENAPAWHSERPVAEPCHSVVKILQQCAIAKVSEELPILARDVVPDKDTTLQLAVNAFGFLVSKLRLRGLHLELPLNLPLNFVAVLFRRMRTTAESLPQEFYLHRTNKDDQLSQDFAACYTLKMPREAGMLPFPDRILVGAPGKGQRCVLPSLGLTASGKGFAFHRRLSSTTFTFTRR